LTFPKRTLHNCSCFGLEISLCHGVDIIISNEGVDWSKVATSKIRTGIALTGLILLKLAEIFPLRLAHDVVLDGFNLLKGLDIEKVNIRWAIKVARLALVIFEFVDEHDSTSRF